MNVQQQHFPQRCLKKHEVIQKVLFIMLTYASSHPLSSRVLEIIIVENLSVP